MLKCDIIIYLFFLNIKLCSGGAVIRTVASQQQGPGFDLSVHALHMFAWVLSSFLPQSKDI